MVVTLACRPATCDSRAIVTLSRKRRWTRVETVRRNHVAVAESASPITATRTRVASGPGLAVTPWARSLNHTASSASGRAAASESTKATSISVGSWR